MKGSTLMIGGDLPVYRLGFGAMRLCDPDCWGPPKDRAAAIMVARRAVELGIDFFDTADSYGLGANEELLAEALYPYPDRLLIATKAGQSRPSAHRWVPLGRPEYLRQQAELSLRRLRLDRIDLYQLHRIDPRVPAADQFGALKELQDEGKVRHIGLSEVSTAQLAEAQKIIDVVSVQSLYNLTDRRHASVLDRCERDGIAFIPWLPIATAVPTRPGSPLADVARELGATPPQVAIAWLLHRSPVMLPIPGTSSAIHLQENADAAQLELSDEQVDRLDRLA